MAKGGRRGFRPESGYDSGGEPIHVSLGELGIELARTCCRPRPADCLLCSAAVRPSSALCPSCWRAAWTEEHPWYVGQLTRERAEAMLRGSPPGAFLLRAGGTAARPRAVLSMARDAGLFGHWDMSGTVSPGEDLRTAAWNLDELRTGATLVPLPAVQAMGATLERRWAPALHARASGPPRLCGGARAAVRAVFLSRQRLHTRLGLWIPDEILLLVLGRLQVQDLGGGGSWRSRIAKADWLHGMASYAACADPEGTGHRQMREWLFACRSQS